MPSIIFSSQVASQGYLRLLLFRLDINLVLTLKEAGEGGQKVPAGQEVVKEVWGANFHGFIFLWVWEDELFVNFKLRNHKDEWMQEFKQTLISMVANFLVLFVTEEILCIIEHEWTMANYCTHLCWWWTILHSITAGIWSRELCQAPCYWCS